MSLRDRRDRCRGCGHPIRFWQNISSCGEFHDRCYWAYHVGIAVADKNRTELEHIRKIVPGRWYGYGMASELLELTAEDRKWLSELNEAFKPSRVSGR